MNREVRVSTGSRLHFGLIGWGPEHERQFGGLGLTIDPPELKITTCAAQEFCTHGPLAERAKSVANRLARHWQLESLPTCHLEIESAPPEHAGLGTGTALALAIGTALAKTLGRNEMSLEELVLATGRGLRSAVGAHGFANGGLIYEDGKAVGELLGRLRARISLPESWRVVLIRTQTKPGLSGGNEQRAFEVVRSTSLQTADKLRQIAVGQIIPAAQEGNFESFSRGITEYNLLAGSCFADVQGGEYASGEIAELVVALQSRGVAGTGQSSWGPTVFAFSPNQESACELAAQIEREKGYAADQILISSPRPQSAHA